MERGKMKKTIKKRGMVKKVFMAMLALAVTVQPLLMFSFADNESYSTEIMNVKGGADAIATFTFDDGVYTNDAMLAEIFKQYNMPLSLMVVPSRILGIPPYTSGYSNVAQLTTLMAGGLVDVQSHSYSHLYIKNAGDGGYNAENNTEQNRINEIVGSKTFLKNNFPGVDPIAFAVPGGSYDNEAIELVMQNYYAARHGSGVTAGTYQTLTPTDDAAPGGWYRLKNMWLNPNREMYQADGTVNIDHIISYLDTCVDKGGWFIGGAHNISGTTLFTGNYDIPADSLKEILNAAKAYRDAGKLWVASFSDATKYLREYESSTVKQYKNVYGMYVEVTMAEKTANGLDLSADVFNMPLTVKVEIPDGWASVRFSQRGVSTTAQTFKEGDKTYAYAEIVPNSGAVLVSNAASTLTEFDANASFTMARGGADAIATMTFDDGGIQSAELLNELCAKYDAKASLMLIPSYLNDSNKQRWHNIVSKGYLYPESHGYSHLTLTEKANPGLTHEIKYRETYESIVALEEFFGDVIPNYTALVYALPQSSADTDVKTDYISKYFYAARGGICVISDDNSNKGKTQSLDPSIGINAGSWYMPYSSRMMPMNNYIEDYKELSVEASIEHLERCIREKGWYISSCHGIVPGENQNITPEDFERILAVMQQYQKENKLWIATYNEAVRYIRERQNSTVKAYTRGDGMYYVDVTMAEKTADNLPLIANIFNLPLTVKLEVPAGWATVEYAQAGGQKQTAATFTEAGKTYAYVDLVPNGGEAYVTYALADSSSDMTTELPVGFYIAPEGSYVPKNENTAYATFTSEAQFLAGNGCIAEYTDTTLTNANIKGVGYVHVYRDLAAAEKIEPNVNLTVNLGGKTIENLNGTKVNTESLSLTIKNGTLTNGGQLHAYNGTLVFENLVFKNNVETIGYGIAAHTWRFKDCILQLNGQGTYFYLGGNPLTRDSKIIFDNTDVVINGSVSSTYGLFRVASHTNTQYSFNVIFESDSSISGNVPLWMSVNESSSVSFKSAQKVIFEEGVTFTEGAIPTFNYRFTERKADGSGTNEAVIIPAEDAKCQIFVGHEVVSLGVLGYKALNGEPLFTESDGVYAVSVPNAELGVGDYVPVPDVWQPASDVAYALWGSEEEYLKGKEPKAQFTSTTINVNDLANGGYVHVYKEITGTTAQIKISESFATLIINFAGNKAKIAGVNIAHDSERSFTLILKNGVVTNTGNIQGRGQDSTFIIENVHWIHNYIAGGNSAMGHGNSLTKWIFRNCQLDFVQNNVFFFIGTNPPKATVNELRFENTDINVLGTVHSTYGLFSIRAHSSLTNNFVITLDKNSSLNGNVPLLASCVENATQSFGAPQMILIEEGFTASTDALINFKYMQTERLEGNTVSAPTLTDANDEICNIIGVKPGAQTTGKYTYSFVKSGDGYVLTMYEIGVWVPSGNTYFAVWESFESFANGDAPLGEYSGELTGAALTMAKNTYVRFYKDVVSSARVDINGDGFDCTVELGGNSWAINGGLFISGNSTLVIKNGTFNHNAKEVFSKPNSTLIFDSLTINVSAADYVLYGACGKLVEYRACVINLNNANNSFFLAGDNKGADFTLNFVDTDINVNKSLYRSLFYVLQQGGGYNAKWTVNLDAKTYVGGTAALNSFITLQESFSSGGAISFVNTQHFNIENGFTLGKNALINLSVYTLIPVDAAASAAENKEVLGQPVVLSANDKNCKVSLGGKLITDARAYYTPNASGDAYTVSSQMDRINAAWYRVNAAGIFVGTLAKKNADGVALFSSVDYNSFNKGEVVYVAQDLVTADKIAGNSLNRTDIVIDLGGNKLTLLHRFELALYVSGEYKAFNVTLRNGAIDGKLGQPIYGGGHNDAVYTFLNIVFTSTQASNMIDVYAGRVVLKGCTFNVSGTAIHFQNYMSPTNYYHSLYADDCVFNVATAVKMRFSSAADFDYADLVIKNSYLNCTSYVIGIPDDTVSPSVDTSYAYFDIIDCHINSQRVLNIENAALCGKVFTRVSNTYFARKPVLYVASGSIANTDTFKLLWAEGERLMEIEGVEGYSYYTGKAPIVDGDVSANLTLYTSFNLNFFTNPEVVKGIYLNGTLLEAIDYEGQRKYTIAGITPDTAAEDITVEVWVEKDGVIYKVPLAYSVLAYAKQINGGNYSSLAKQLVASAVEYIKAAYVYCGKAAPEFVGEEIARQDMAAEKVMSLTSAISSVQLDLKESPYVRFNLRAGYSGKLQVGTYSYEVIDGKVGALGYVELDLRAYSITDTITIIADTTVEYSIKNYFNSDAVAADAKLSALIEALYVYGTYAKQYKAENPELN